MKRHSVLNRVLVTAFIALLGTGYAVGQSKASSTSADPGGAGKGVSDKTESIVAKHNESGENPPTRATTNGRRVDPKGSIPPPPPMDPESGESIHLDINTLPAGESITITFEVTVDSPFPTGVTEVANQGTVSGTNFSSVLTDDPDVGGAADPTVTQVATGDLGVIAITSPVSGCDLTNAEVISIVISNFTSSSQTGFDVRFEVTGPINTGPVTENVGALVVPGNGDASFTFAGTADFSAPGTYTITATTLLSGDANTGNDETDTEVDVDVSPTFTSVSPTSQSVQYSDPISDVTIESSSSSATASTSWKKNGDPSFTVGLPSALTLVGTSSPWTLEGIANVAPGNYTVRVTLTSGGGCEAYTDIALAVVKEDAVATYTGPDFVSTSGINSCSATLTLSATVLDITVVSPGSDPDGGDIRKAKVRFVNSGSYPFNVSAPVGLVSPGDLLTGTATANVTVSLNSLDCSGGGTTITVVAIVDSYYTNAAGTLPLATATITISVPDKDNVSGGGFLVMSNSSSAGQYRGKPGTKTNFGYTMKYNKKGKSLQGQANIIVRAYNDSMYQIKSNAINSMSVSGKRANFSTKANLTNITDPLNPYSLGGNVTLIVEMLDSSRAGQSDSIGITLQNNAGGLLYSSEWNGTRTVMRSLRQPSGGGNVRVMSTAITKPAEEIDLQVPREFVLFQNHPNPFNPSTTIRFGLPEPAQVTLQIYNSLGQLVNTLVSSPMDIGYHEVVWNGENESGLDVVSGVYFYRIQTGSFVQTKKMLLIK